MTARTAEAFERGLAWADAARLAAVLTPGLRAETASRLARSTRLADRIAAWSAGRLGAGSVVALDPVDRMLVLAAADELTELGVRAGAVWHGRRVRRLLLGRDIAAFTERHGEAARDAALRHAGPDITDEGGDLADAVGQDGRACLGAWLADLPAWAQARLGLIVLETEAPGNLHRAHGPALIRRLAPDVLAA